MKMCHVSEGRATNDRLKYLVREKRAPFKTNSIPPVKREKQKRKNEKGGGGEEKKANHLTKSKNSTKLARVKL